VCLSLERGLRGEAQSRSGVAVTGPGVRAGRKDSGTGRVLGSLGETSTQMQPCAAAFEVQSECSLVRVHKAWSNGLVLKDETRYAF
jgi:hypothetical protein